MSEGAGDKWQAPIGRGSGVRVVLLKILTSTPIGCKKNPFLGIEVHLTLDRIGFLMHDIIHKQKLGDCSPLALVCMWSPQFCFELHC